MNSNPNVACPRCDGRLSETHDPNEYRCERCGRRHRQVVVENVERFERVAERGGPLAPVAEAALEGLEE